MSAVTRKADIRRDEGDVRFVPLPEVAILLDHLVGTEEERGRNDNTERLGGLEADDELELRRLLHRQIGRFRTLQKFGDLIGGERIQFLSCDAITREAS